jgi:hypothetical protein
MGEACGMYGEEERCTQGFGREIWGKRGHLEDLGVDN